MTYLAKLKIGYNNKQWVLLCTNLVLWTVVSLGVDAFWYGDGELCPFSTESFEYSWGVVEWLVYGVGPFVVVYYLNKGK